MKYSFSYSVPTAKPSADQFFAQAQALEKSNQWDTAKARYEQALALDPGHLNSLQHLGALCSKTGAFERAVQCFGTVNERVPDFAQAYRYRGLAFASLNRFEDALQCFDKAVTLEPTHTGALFNRAVALQSLLRLDLAISAYGDVLSCDPLHEAAHWNLGICHLLSGKLEKGFALFENRWKNESFQKHQGSRQFAQPQWLGAENLAGKTLFVHAEQGLGDTIQFVRYAKMLAKTGAKLVFEVQPPLLALMQTLDAPVTWIARGDAIPAHDFQSPLLSLPLALKTELLSIPAEPAYLHPQQDQLAHWAKRLGVLPGLKVGLVWQGSTTHAADAQRSIPLEVLLANLPPSIQYVALQKELSDADKASLAKHPQVLTIGADLDDFADTAAACAALDVVVAVDTSVAHLAGALGKPVWLMLASEPDWRWLLNRSDSPWYPCARLFRQTSPANWTSVVAEVGKGLVQLTTSKGLV